MKILKDLKKIGFSKLTLLDDALKRIASLTTSTSLIEVETSKALDRILGENIISAIDIPPFNRSAMDGYAVRAEDTFGASLSNPKKIKKIGTIEIGEQSDLAVEPGQAIRISTGAAIPNGSDSVVKIEDTKIDKNEISFYTSVVPGKNVSKKGEDIPRGTEILKSGIKIKASHIALLSSLGFNVLKVKEKPLVSIFAVGDELIETGNPLPINKIYNSNSPMISSLVETYGGQVVRKLSLKDDKAEIKKNLLLSSTDSQIIIFTGGTSVGTKDFLPEIVHECGEVLVHGIAMRPGSPILIGSLKQSLIFCLPGTPVAAYVCFLSIVGITIRKMLGCSNLDPRIEIIAEMSQDVPVGQMGYIHFLRVKLEKKGSKVLALPVKLKGSGVISSLTQSDGIVEISEEMEGMKKGDNVLVYLYP
ncbi:MAG: molybdopterin molybdenumtransferase MoeA [Candidatus Lokiarchaeota archaeon]|nr:molybdopterin molybdenumtransferase MoeA [Candidatus Lokiarchaeota archaeon]